MLNLKTIAIAIFSALSLAATTRYLAVDGLNAKGQASVTTPASGYYSVAVKSGDGKAYIKNSSGTENALATEAYVASAVAGTAFTRFSIEGNVVPYVSINGAHYQPASVTLSTVYLTCLNSGSSGSTTFQVNQYRSGSLQGSATASISASSSAPASSAASLSGSLSLVAGDVITVDVNASAIGASDCSLEY